MEGSAILGDDSLLGKMLKLCGEAEDKLAQELIHFELQVERDVIEPLFVLAEVEIPNIQKQRKHLAKLVLDMDSSRTRWQQSAKSSGLSSNLQPSGAKADALREEMEEAANRVEICRDQLSADMYNFVAKEIDYANYFQTLIKVQAEYHRKSLALLQNVLPQIKAQQEAWIEKPSFGKPLEEHLAVSDREIAFPIEACVTMLLECGMQEEGLFRVAPSASKLKKLKAALDCCVVDVQEYSADPHAIAGALKSYLRELPEPLMTFELYEEWIQASNIQDQDKRLQALWNALEKLPKASYNNLRYLIKFLANLTEYQDANKMTPSNIAIVLGPNLLWPQTEGNITEMMATVSLQIVAIIEPLIQHADWFFPGDIEFNLTGNYGSPVHVNHNANYNSMPSPDMDHADHKHSDQTRRPLSVATDNMMLEFYKKDGTDGVSSNWSDSCYIYPSPEDDKSPLYPHCSSFYPYPPRTSPCTRLEPPLPPYHWAGNNPTLPPPCSSSCFSSPSFQPFDINFLHLPKQISLTELHGPETNLSFVTTKTAFTLSKPNPPGTLPYSSSMSVSSPWVSCTCARDRGAGLTSTLKTKELSLVSGQKGSPACSHTTPGGGTAQQPPGPTLQLSTEQSPHTLRKVSKKLTPLPAKGPYGQSGGMSDPSMGQPSPASLSPTPPSTPSPYGLSYPPGYSLSSGPLSPVAAPSLSSPPSLTSTLTKSRPAPKPRQRPTLPPPQPPTSSASGSSPQSTEHTLLDDISPGESMSTDLAHLDIPSIHVEVGATLHLDPSGQVQRHPVPGKISSEEDSESTAL
ncbi:rho GTPase-activating protein 44 isoform X3 [Crotalus tigris]|uniref:rho GTPase-activating protein 44 isoform X3 n=1 Tax=Crotalus tigris TaxID=88082 RepID=UPI00192F6F94|nr:rho GTPase-activating protein 44 isoform X3 [Crotalus tigris]